MKSRLLTTTAALSVALSAIQPLPLSAQDGQRANCTSENPEDCPPRKRGEQRSGEGAGQQERRNRQPDAARQQQEDRPAGQQRQQRANQPDERPDARPAGRATDAERPEREQRKQRAAPQDDTPAARPARPAAEAERPADGERSGQPRRAAPEGGAGGEAGRPADREREQRRAAPDREEEPGAADRTRSRENQREAEPRDGGEAPRADGQRSRQGDDGPDGDELRRMLEEEDAGRGAPREGDRPVRSTDENDSPVVGTDRAPRDRARPDTERNNPVANDAERPRRGDGRDADAERRTRDGDRATRDAGRAEEERRPSREEARRSLSRALDDPDRSTAAAAASAGNAREAAEDARRSARRAERITEEDFRSSREDFATRATDWRAGEDDDDDDDDGGLSNFEKFGLLALGGLAVGALLNNRDEVVSNSGDRVVVQRADGTYAVLKDDDTLLRRPGSEVITESYADGSTRSVVTREDGTQIVTIRDAAGRVLRRSAVDRYGQEVLLIDDLAPVEQIDFSRLPEPAPVYNFTETRDKAALREALEQMRGRDLDRTYSLRQIRDYREVRALAPAIDVDQITFDSGSAAIVPEEAEKLAMLGQTISDMIAERPEEVFLIEGHTDAVGSAASNLTLSDRRAESVALALTEYYDVPPENLVVQGYGEEDLRVDTEGPDQRNRRVAVRLITPLLQTAAN
ncbi:OmpA family protein [Rhodobacter sp. CZR27]|uniref:OmpA family protein n=1 Tax=Rhodobacter sp. CZR27 TaxID=2033869 RepID=UPI000BBEF30D|nr:OmpA family protein [Rhodobacter sp. CZR27]